MAVRMKDIAQNRRIPVTVSKVLRNKKEWARRRANVFFSV